MDNLREALESAFEDNKESGDMQHDDGQEHKQAQDDTEQKQPSQETKTPTNVDVDRANEPVAQLETEIKAPSSWKAEAKQAYIKAERGEALTPQETKILTAEANRRESDFLKGIEEFKGHAHRARQYEQAIAPYMANIKQLGVPAHEAIGRLLDADNRLRNGDPHSKAAYLHQLAQEYGVDLGQAQNIQAPDPQTQYLMSQLNELRQTQQMWQNSIQQQEQERANQQLEHFATADKSHFDAVRNDMADLMESGKATTLEAAYDMAVWMRPDIRQSLIEEQQQGIRRNQEEATRAARAKAATVSIRGSTPISSSSQAVAGSLRDILESQFDK